MEKHQQDSTIIDIPSCVVVENTATTATTHTAAATTICMPSLSASTVSLAYDTDSSVASSTCCNHPGEHIYMEHQSRRVQQQQQQLHQQLQQHMQLQTADALAIAKAATTIAEGNSVRAAAATADAAKPTTNAVNCDVGGGDDDDVDFKADQHRRSWPLFICLISLIEITIFVYDLMNARQQTSGRRPLAAATSGVASLDTPVTIVPTDSVFIYRPDRRLEVWRFISYMFLHANWFHLGFNVIVQLFYGVPLEVMHGSLRVAIIYFAGVFAGSLGTSVVDSEVYLVGASGGVYALLAAHLANITLNYGQMRYAVAQLVSVVIFVSCDLGYALYTQYLTASSSAATLATLGSSVSASDLHSGRVVLISSRNGVGSVPSGGGAPPVSYIAHLTGALAGLTIGLLVLKNFEHRSYENLIWWLALGVYSAFTVFAIVFNLINTVTAQLMEEQGEVITQHLMHDLGVS